MADETRPYRLCESCQQVDNHPRHVLATAPGQGATPPDVADRALREAVKNGWDITALLSQLKDDEELTKHMDCCAADGCQICAGVLAGAKEQHGLALAKELAPKDVN